MEEYKIDGLKAIAITKDEKFVYCRTELDCDARREMDLDYFGFIGYIMKRYREGNIPDGIRIELVL